MVEDIRTYHKRAAQLQPGNIIVDDGGRVVRVTRVTHLVEIQVTDGKVFTFRTDDGVLALDLSRAQNVVDFVRIDGGQSLPVQYYGDVFDDIFVPQNDHKEEKDFIDNLKKALGDIDETTED